MTDDDTNDDPVIDASGHLVESDSVNIIKEMAMDAVYFLIGITGMTLIGVAVYSV